MGLCSSQRLLSKCCLCQGTLRTGPVSAPAQQLTGSASARWSHYELPLSPTHSTQVPDNWRVISITQIPQKASNHPNQSLPTTCHLFLPQKMSPCCFPMLCPLTNSRPSVVWCTALLLRTVACYLFQNHHLLSCCPHHTLIVIKPAARNSCLQPEEGEQQGSLQFLWVIGKWVHNGRSNSRTTGDSPGNSPE